MVRKEKYTKPFRAQSATHHHSTDTKAWNATLSSSPSPKGPLPSASVRCGYFGKFKQAPSVNYAAYLL